MRPIVFERRRGRKRKLTHMRSADVDVKVVAQSMPHRREVRRPEDRHDDRAADVMGRMRLNGWITERQYQAALILRTVVRHMQLVFDVPNWNVGAMPLDGLLRGAGAISAEVAQRYRDQHRKVCDMLLRDCGVRVSQVVMRLVVYDERVPIEHQPLLLGGLDRLARFYRVPEDK
jgi:hypothetical protein